MQFYPQFLIVSQLTNMSSQEVSTNNRGGEDVPQPNELMMDEEGGQDISEAVEEPPAKRSKIDKSYQIAKTLVLEALEWSIELDKGCYPYTPTSTFEIPG